MVLNELRGLLRRLALHLHNFITEFLHFLPVRHPSKTHPTHNRLQMRAPDAYRQSVPTHNTHPDTQQRMRLQITHPPIHDLSVRVESLDRARVHAPLKVLLRFFVCERAPRDCPQRAPRGQRDNARERDPERRGGVGGKVCRELDGFGVVRAELDKRHRDAVRTRVSVRLEDATAVQHGCVPLTLFGIYAHTPERLDGRDRSSLWVGGPEDPWI